MDKYIMLKDEKLGKLVFKFSIPAITAMAVSALYNVIDRIFVGRGVGSEALSGIALTSPLMMILTAFALLIAAGTAVRVSIKLGEGEIEEAENIIGNAFSLSIIEGVILTLIMNLFLQQILKLLGGEGVSLAYAQQFMYIITFSIVFQIPGYTLNYAIRAKGNPLMALMTIIIGAIVNIILNPIFIFGLHLGVKGSALATCISQLITLIWTVLYFTNSSSTLKLRIKFLKLKISIVKGIITLGLPYLCLQGLSSVTLVTANIVFFKYGGNNGLATIGIVGVIYSMFQMMINGISQGIAPIIGYNYGANNFDRVKGTIKIGMVLGITICFIGFITTLFFNKNIMTLFSKNNTYLQSTGAIGLKYVCLALPFLGFQIIVSGYYQAIGKYKVAVLINLLRSLTPTVLLVVLSRKIGLYGGFVAFPISDVIVALIVAIFILWEWKKKRKL